MDRMTLVLFLVALALFYVFHSAFAQSRSHKLVAIFAQSSRMAAVARHRRY